MLTARVIMSFKADNLIQFIIKKRWYFFISLIIVCLVLTFSLKNLKIDNSLDIWFLEDDPTLLKYNEFKKIYGSDEVILAYIKPEKNIYDPEFLDRLSKVSKTIEASTLIRRVLSPTDAPHVYLDNDTLVVEKMHDSNAKNKIEDRLNSNPLWPRLLLSQDKKDAIIFIEPKDSEDMDLVRPKILEFVHKSLEGFNYKIAGLGVLHEEINKISLNDSTVFTGASYLLLFILLLILFRSFSILLASTITILLSILLFLEIYALSGQSFNMVSIILPTLLIILNLTNIVHIFSHMNKTENIPQKLHKCYSYVLFPCFFSTTTTAIGFLALTTSPMEILKSFGLFASLGLFLAFAVAISVCTIILAKKQDMQFKKTIPFEAFLDWLNNKVQAYYKLITVFGIILIVIAGIGILNLNIDTFSINFLLDKNKTKQDSKYIEKHYGYYLPLELRLLTGTIKEPAFLNKLDRFQNLLNQDKQIQNSTSIVDLVKHLNKVLTDNKENSRKIPKTIEAVAQELLLYEFDEDNDLEYFSTPEYNEARLTLRIPMVSSQNMASIITRVETIFNEIFIETKLLFGGYIPLYAKMTQYVTSSQVKSFLLALSIILVIMAILFRSFKIMLIGILPNLLPIFLTLGFMGITGINLDIATVTVAAIAIGISVDDTIHFLFMYRKLKNDDKNTRDAVRGTLMTAGNAIIITSLILMLGYMVLILANIKSIIFFGLLLSVTMLSALISDLLLLPSLLILFDRKAKDTK